MENNETFIGANAAAKRYGVSLALLRRRVKRGDLKVFRDPLDDRKKLLRVRDLERLCFPVALAEQRQQEPK